MSDEYTKEELNEIRKIKLELMKKVHKSKRKGYAYLTEMSRKYWEEWERKHNGKKEDQEF